MPSDKAREYEHAAERLEGDRRKVQEYLLRRGALTARQQCSADRETMIAVAGSEERFWTLVADLLDTASRFLRDSVEIVASRGTSVKTAPNARMSSSAKP